MKTITTVLLLLSTTLLFGQTDLDSVDSELLTHPLYQYYDSIQKGLTDYDDRRVLFIADSAGHKVIVDKAYFNSYRTRYPKGPYSNTVFGNDYIDKSGGYQLMVHIPQGGLTDKEFDKIFKQLRTRKTEKKE